MAIVSYLLIYSTEFCNALLTYLSGFFSYKQFAMGVAVLFAFVLLISLFPERGPVPKRFLATFFLSAAIAALYSLTPRICASSGQVDQSVYSGFQLALLGQTVPGVIIAALVASTDTAQEKIQRMAPLVGILFTMIAFISAFRPSGSTSGGFAISDNGMNYQNTSYMAAYASSLLSYFLLTKNAPVHLKIFQNQASGIVAFVLIFINLLSILLSGGRGGFIAFLIFLCVTLYFAFSQGQLTKKLLMRGLFILFVLIVCGYAALRYASNSTVSTNGFARIQGLLSGTQDEGRAELRAEALAMFKESPLVGCGLGSVFIRMGSYSHNLVTDALAETGLLGTSTLLFTLWTTVRKGLHMVRDDSLNCLWAYFFLAGFIMSLFSGYWLTQFPMWWSVSLILNRKNK